VTGRPGQAGPPCNTHILIVPPLGDVGILDFARADAIIAAGRSAARDALPALADLLAPRFS
jgi:predicted acylesterase/phospholipase RssA